MNTINDTYYKNKQRQFSRKGKFLQNVKKPQKPQPSGENTRKTLAISEGPELLKNLQREMALKNPHLKQTSSFLTPSRDALDSLNAAPRQKVTVQGTTTAADCSPRYALTDRSPVSPVMHRTNHVAKSVSVHLPKCIDCLKLKCCYPQKPGEDTFADQDLFKMRLREPEISFPDVKSQVKVGVLFSKQLPRKDCLALNVSEKRFEVRDDGEVLFRKSFVVDFSKGPPRKEFLCNNSPTFYNAKDSLIRTRLDVGAVKYRAVSKRTPGGEKQKVLTKNVNRLFRKLDELWLRGTK